MRGQLAIAPDVAFAVIAPAGFRLLAAFEFVARTEGRVLTLTAGTNGQHSGINDPHYKGCAYDLRSHDLPSAEVKQQVLQAILEELSDSATDPVVATQGGLATLLFWGWLEDAGTPNEHFHVQLRNGREYLPIYSPLGGGPLAV